MNKIGKLTAAVLVAASLGACSSLSSVIGTVGSLASVITSDTGQAFLGALGVGGTLTKSIQDIIGKLNGGISSPVAHQALQTICYSLPWAEGALVTFGPSANIDPRVIADTHAAVQGFLDGPCTNPPSNLSQAVSQGTQLYLIIANQLKSSGVPVAMPVSARMSVR